MRDNPLLMIRHLIVLTIVTILSVGSAAQSARAASGLNAQETVTLESAVIDIWPEYDQPSVLVMYNITLSPEVKLPASLTISIPASAGQPHAVATKDINGLYNLQYQVVPAGEWSRITFTTSMPDFRIEYYDESLSMQNNQRSFNYRWAGDYAVQNMVVHVQQPSRATQMSFSQNMGSGVVEDGLTYFTLLPGPQEAGTEFKLDISYQKPDDSLTNPDSFQQVQPSQTVDDQTQGRVTLNEIIPWTLGGLGALLIGTGLWWYWRTGRQNAAGTSVGRARHTRRGSAAPGAPTSAKQDGSYCHQCGKRAAAGDGFCRACGTKLR